MYLILHAHERRLCSNWVRHGSTIISYPQCSLTFMRERYWEPGTNWFAKTCDFKMCREARDYNLTNDELSLDNNASLW